MTKSQVIALIQQWIIQNGNQEITADVLRPILEAMVNQPNDLIGDVNLLDTTYQNDLVGAINEVRSIAVGNSGLVIHYGTALPNVTPPIPTNLGDFYARTSGGTIISFWQYNGNVWVEQKPLKVKTVFRFVSLVGIDTNKPQIEWAKDAINQAIANNGNFTCEVGEIMTFYFNVIVGYVSGGSTTQTVISRRYFRLCTGENICSGITNAFDELMPDGGDDLYVEGDLVIDLGDIGINDVWDAFNNDVNQPFEMTDEKFVQATQNGELKLWQWRGGNGSFGNGATLATAPDFLDLTEQPGIIPLDFTYFDYPDISDLLSHQTEQSQRDLILVRDASADSNITFASGETRYQAMYRLKTSTKTGSINDYILVSTPYGNGGTGGGATPTLQDVVDASAGVGGYVFASFPSGNNIEDDGAGLTFTGDITMASGNGDNYIGANNSGLFVRAENSTGNNGDFLVNVDGNGRIGWRKLLDDTVTSLTKFWSSQKISDELDTKVDKEVGKGLSQENYTTTEKNKLAGLESSKWRGLYLSKSALELANPTPAGGDYADVDAGTGVDTIRYVYDETDAQWIESGSGSPLTGAQIKTMYEAQPDTNAFTDSLKSWLEGMTEQFTTALKNSYDSTVNWISTNGSNLLSHLSRTDNPHNVTKAQIGLPDVTNDAEPNDPNTTLQGNDFNGANQLLKLDANAQLDAGKISGLGDKVLEEIGTFEENDISDLVTGTYTTGSEVKVLDASGDTSLTFPTGASKVAFYKKLNSVNGDLTDWQLISAPYAIQETPHFSLTGNITLDPTHNDGFVFWDGGVLTIDPNTKTYQEKFNCIVKNRPQTDSSIVLVAKTGVQYYVEGKAVANSGTYIFWGGGSISVVKEAGTENYYIKGNVQ